MRYVVIEVCVEKKFQSPSQTEANRVRAEATETHLGRLGVEACEFTASACASGSLNSCACESCDVLNLEASLSHSASQQTAVVHGMPRTRSALREAVRRSRQSLRNFDQYDIMSAAQLYRPNEHPNSPDVNASMCSPV